MATLTTNLNYLAPTGFKVVIDRENYPNLEYFAQSINHPSMETNAAEIPFKRITTVPFAGDKISHNPVQIIMMMDEDMTAYTEMYDWMHRLVEEPQVTQGRQRFQRTKESGSLADNVPTFADIQVSILTSSNNVNKKIIYKNAIPISLGDVEFTAVSDGQYLSFPTVFRFDYFTIS